MEALNKGFGFIVDTNDEYDLKSVSLKSQETTEETKKTFDIYKYSKTDITYKFLYNICFSFSQCSTINYNKQL